MGLAMLQLSPRCPPFHHLIYGNPSPSSNALVEAISITNGPSRHPPVLSSTSSLQFHHYQKNYSTKPLASNGLFLTRSQRRSGEGQRSCSCLSPAQATSVTDNVDALQLEELLERMSLALGVQDYSPGEHTVVTGKQLLFGLEGDWKLVWCDGRFYEQYNGTEMTIEHGYDGKHSPWSADAGGRVSILELDDLEVCLLVSWIRTGYWLTEEGRNKTVIQLEGDGLLSSNFHLPAELQVTIRLKHRKVVTYVAIDSSTLLPVRLQSKTCGSMDRWEFTDWQCLLPGRSRKFARSIAHFPAAGGKDLYTVECVTLVDSAESQSFDSYNYALPNTRIVPRQNKSYQHAHMDNHYLPSVKMVQAASGHFLVCPYINGQEIGYFIVDTGASGMVISPKKANDVGMDAFGEIFVTGVEGTFKSCFRRGKSFRLGPFILENPIFLEAPLDVVLRGVSEEVSGICGYDLFYHCVVEMSNLECRLSLFDPLNYKPPENLVKWESIYMLENVPHTKVKFNGNNAILLLDTGACGMDIVFHKRAVQEFKLLNHLKLMGSAEVSGMSASEKGIQVQYGSLDEVEVAGQFFQQTKVFYFMNDEGSLDLSVYTAGILCGGLLVDSLVVFDYSQHRIAIMKSQIMFD